jgi:hypothetical protein
MADRETWQRPLCEACNKSMTFINVVGSPEGRCHLSVLALQQAVLGEAQARPKVGRLSWRHLPVAPAAVPGELSASERVARCGGPCPLRIALNVSALRLLSRPMHPCSPAAVTVRVVLASKIQMSRVALAPPVR